MLVVATGALSLLMLMSVVRLIYRLDRWSRATRDEDTEQMYAAGMAVIMGILTLAALIATATHLSRGV